MTTVTTTTTTTAKLGFHSHLVETQRVLAELVERGEIVIDNIAREDFILQCTFHPKVLALLGRIDEELYIAEYVESVKQTMVEMDLSGVDGYNKLMNLALSSMREALGDEGTQRAVNLCHGLMHRCMAAAKDAACH